MLDHTFDLLRDILKKESGLHLEADKKYLLESRLHTLLRRFECETPEEFAEHVKTRPSVRLGLIEAMTINETLFFRDTKPFDSLKNIMLPTLMQNRPATTLKIWSAACSSGQEANSMAITLKELQGKLDLNGWRIEITGTDLASEMVAKAK